MSIPNRDETHGGIEAVGEVSQEIKHAMRDGRNWKRLPSAEALGGELDSPFALLR